MGLPAIKGSSSLYLAVVYSFFLFIFVFPGWLFGYVPTIGEFRWLWNRERRITNPLLLVYKNPSGLELNIYLKPGGPWAKEVLYEGVRQEWIVKKDKTMFVFRKGSWLQYERDTLNWDDWLFELNLKWIESMVPRDFFFTRAVGEYTKKNWIWLYGARHHHDPATWVAFLRNPLRPGMIQGGGLFVYCLYERDILFPTTILIRTRTGEAKFVLEEFKISPDPERVPLPRFLEKP